MRDLDMLGADLQRPPAPAWRKAAVAAAGAVAGALLWRRHRVLGFLGGGALAGNAYAVATSERSLTSATRRLGQHVMATVGALSLPSHPALGYVGGVVAGSILLNGDDGYGLAVVRDAVAKATARAGSPAPLALPPAGA